MQQTVISKNNNFDFLRLLFASLVILSHSYPLSGSTDKEPLTILTNDYLDFGSFSVNCFFILSGYLILISLQRSKSVLEYLWKRFLRLFPALVCILILTMLFLPIIYEGKNIWEESSYWTYFFNNLTLYNIQFNVNGIFENNPFKGMINGSLWTLCYEFSMYLLILPFFIIRNNNKVLLFCILICFIIFYSLYQFFPNFLGKYFDTILNMRSLDFYRLATYFTAGSLIVFIDKRIISHYITLSILAVGGIISLHSFHSLLPIVLAPLIIGVGQNATPYIKNLGHKIGDLSYGIYIYGFIIQQTLVYYFRPDVWSLTFYSLLVTIIFAYFSWHYVEKIFLRYKSWKF